MDYMAPWNDEDMNGDGGIGGIGAELGPGDLANLLVKLTDNALSGATFERRAAARGVLDAFKQSCFAEEDTMNVIAVIEQLVNDQEQLVRQEIMDQLPEVALFCHEEGPYLDFVVPQHILPHIVKLITDKFSQVRKAAQTGLLSLLDKGIIAPRQVAEQVCPVIMEYTEPNVMDDYRTEVTGFMSKLARLVGKEIVVNWFLERFCTLCQDPMFQVRRVCASSMGEISAVIGTRLTEAVLLPEFLALCKDDVWGVRKGCAEIFTEIARLCQLPTRRDKLTPVFVKLLEDSTRWVKVAAYQSLGPFIATFSMDDDADDEVPELTDFEKTFIEKVKDCPNLMAGQGQMHKGPNHRSSMLGSESTEDLTSICIQDDNDDDEEKGSKEDDNGEENEEKKQHLPKDYNFSSNEVKLYSVPDNLEDNKKDEGGDSNIQQYNNSNSSTEEPSLNTSSISPQITVYSENKDDSSGIHIRVEKEVPCINDFSGSENLTAKKICRSSSVLSHRPSSIGGGGGANSNTSSTIASAVVTSVNCLPNNNSIQMENTPTYNTFQYWRIPLPEIELDIGLVEGKPASVHVRAKVEDPQMNATYQSEISVNLTSDANVHQQQSISAGEDKDNSKKVENIQIQTISTSTVSDNENETITKLESSLSNTSVSLVDGVVSEVHKSYMDLCNVISSPATDAALKDKEGNPNSKSNDEYNKIMEDISLDMTHLNTADDESDDDDDDEEENENMLGFRGPYQLAPYSFEEAPKKTRLLPELSYVFHIKQDIVPDILLDHFIGMSQDGDTELAPCCVFNLPAVVLTLGPQHWSVLRECYENLAGSLQWKVRYTLAACLHEIADILGPELSERDLIPFYNALMKDLDEVRIGLLKHLSGFFKILGGEERKKCLKSVRGFIKTDNPRNWRFRLELVYQIKRLVNMFEADEVFKHICPVCIDLIKDNVAEIRKESLQAVAYVVKHLNERHAARLKCYGGGSGDPDNPVHEFLVDLVKALSESSKWVRRQTFAALSGQLLATNALYPSQFAQDILPHLLGLSDDKVPNVRLVVARSIVSCVLEQDCFNDPSDPNSSRVMETLTKLQEDVDQDVRYHSQPNKALLEEEQVGVVEVVENNELLLAEK